MTQTSCVHKEIWFALVSGAKKPENVDLNMFIKLLSDSFELFCIIKQNDESVIL